VKGLSGLSYESAMLFCTTVGVAACTDNCKPSLELNQQRISIHCDLWKALCKTRGLFALDVEMTLWEEDSKMSGVWVFLEEAVTIFLHKDDKNSVFATTIL
jgi:hypothetical protein